MNRLRTFRKMIGGLLLVAALVPVLVGCSVITPPFGGGAMETKNQATGEAWYVKNSYFWFLFLFLTSSDIYYCDGKGTCKEAVVQR